ncbi:MAG: PilZ domain-containing protein [Planctomycetes bacterium]|nr:PilZ domain-containing protein [Planctomycetota bacterium]
MSTATATPATILPSSPERRIAPRRQPAMGTVCRLDSEDGGPAALALVWNISTSGISVLVADPRPAGTALRGYLEKTEGDHMHRVAMRVVHSKKLESGDYFLGAHFDRPLTAEELKPFVAE